MLQPIFPAERWHPASDPKVQQDSPPENGVSRIHASEHQLPHTDRNSERAIWGQPKAVLRYTGGQGKVRGGPCSSLQEADFGPDWPKSQKFQQPQIDNQGKNSVLPQEEGKGMYILEIQEKIELNLKKEKISNKKKNM